MSAPSSRRPCLALHWRVLSRASAANHRESISACRRDALVIATANVTSKATSVRNIPAHREGAGGEQKSQRKQRAPSAFS